MTEIASIIARDFCCIRELTLSLDQQGLVLIEGENGSGKSTIFRALMWGLYGTSVEGDDTQAVIRHGAAEAMVHVLLRDDRGETWDVRRRRTEKHTHLEVVRDGVETVDGTRQSLQELIIKIVGMDAETFRSTALYSQGDVLRFSNPSVRDSQRKDILQRVMGTAALQKCAEWARDQVTGVRAFVDKSRAEMDALDAEKRGIDLPRVTTEHYDWDRKRLDDERQLREQAAEIGREYDTTAKTDEVAEAQREHANAVQDHQRAATEDRLARDALMEMKQELVGRKAALVLASQMEARAVADVERLSGDACPTCTAPLDDGAPLDHLESLREALASAQAERESEQVLCEIAAAQVNAIGEAVMDAALRLKATAANLGEMEETLRLRREAQETAKSRLEEAQRLAAAADQLLKTDNPHAAPLHRARDRVYQIELREVVLRQEIQKQENALAHASFWAKGFGNQGLPSYALDQTMIDLTEMTNRHLARLSEGEISVEFATQRALKSRAEVRDEISVSATIRGLTGYLPSTGQQKRIDVASGFALMDLARRRGTHLNLLMLDEVLDGLDARGREAAMAHLHELRAEFPTVLVISHEQDIAETFDRRLTMVGGAVVEK